MLPPPTGLIYSRAVTGTPVAWGTDAHDVSRLQHFAVAATRAQTATFASRWRSAFTLVEMLVVMAVIVVMLTVTVPVFKNLLGGRAVEKSINTVTGAIELGRATAIANRTYVWVLFQNVVNADNNYELDCAVVMSMNGLYSYDPKDLRAMSKLITIPNVKDVMFADLPLAIRKVAPTDLNNNANYIAGYYSGDTGSSFPDFIVGGHNFKGSDFIGLDDTGEVGTSPTIDPYHLLVEPKVCIGLAQTRGTTVQANATDGAIVASDGGSGKIRVFRP